MEELELNEKTTGSNIICGRNSVRRPSTFSASATSATACWREPCRGGMDVIYSHLNEYRHEEPTDYGTCPDCKNKKKGKRK